ncbi:class I SAM-dependent methyltransferase [Pectinatus sottacetonis]|uniref:class I SAM-dependent methyltransferase n=1 Tax=Pectinatus sottacetonis TaxID=1002795 RepID=UPI001E4D45E0|nr:methyltransferase domain-containing protein [Pectinatus sottacetonis]
MKLKETVITIESYNKNVKAYAEKFMEFPSYMKQIAKLYDLLEDGVSVLDLGCGPGNVSRQLQRGKKLNYLGIDLSEEMIKLAQGNNKNGKFSVQDITQVNFPRNNFNCIVFSFCIVHLETNMALELLSRAIKWLKKDGFIYLSFMEGKKPGYETTSFSSEPIFFNYYQSNEIKKLLIKNGIKIIQEDSSDYVENNGVITKDIFFIGQKI